MRASHFELMDLELWLDRRLRMRGVWIFEGGTDQAARRERAREAILSKKLADTVAGENGRGKQLTYGEAFERVYGQPLRTTIRSESTC